jgi:hypothetical protein
MKNYEITFHDGRMKYIAADKAEANAGTTVFYAGGRIMAAVRHSEVAILNETGSVQPPRGRSMAAHDEGRAALMQRHGSESVA